MHKQFHLCIVCVSKVEEGGKALMMLSIDKPLPDDVLNELTASAEILYVDKIELM